MRPVGSGLILQPVGLAVLNWLGLGLRIERLGARIDRLYGKASRSGRTVLDVRYEALGPKRGLAVHRATLFNVLHDAVKSAGITIETNRAIADCRDGYLKFRDGRSSTRFDLIVDALGARSPLKQRTRGRVVEKSLPYGAVWASLPWPGKGFDPHALEQRYDKASVMIGVLPIGRMAENGQDQCAFFWSLKADSHEQWKHRGLSAWKDEVLRHWPEVASVLDHIRSSDDLTLARYQHHTLSTPYGDRLISIGDSAHATSPQLGQGANMALLDVRALTESMLAQKYFTRVARDYAHRRGRHVKVYQALSSMFTPFYQSDSSVLAAVRDQLVAPLAALPPAQKLLARMVAGTFVEPIREGLEFSRDVSTSGEGSFGWHAVPGDGDSGSDSSSSDGGGDGGGGD
jgi:salicylate hydroxylase